MTKFKFVDALGNEHLVRRPGAIFSERNRVQQQLEVYLHHFPIDDWLSFYDGRVWQFGKDEDTDQFGANHLWRIIKHERIAKTMDQKLLKAIERGKNLEPTFILHDPDTYNYELVKLNFLNSWVVVRTSKEPKETGTHREYDEEHLVDYQLRYYPEEFESLFDGRVWLPGGPTNLKLSAGRILQIIKKKEISVDPILLKRIQDGDKIDGNIYVHDYDSFNYEVSGSLDHNSHLKLIHSVPKLHRSNWS